MRRLSGATASAAVALMLAAPAAMAADDAPVPEGFTPPLTSVEVFTAWETPLTSVTIFSTKPKEATTEALEEGLKAEQDGGQKVVQLEDRFLFDFGSASLRPTAKDSLNTVAAILAEGSSKVEVIGHTDSLGGDAVNQPLSEKRAQAVTDFLVTAGIDKGRITSSGKGSSDPIADNKHADGRDNPAGRQQNRRVEIRYSS
ncbi:hypothetical protein GCM10023153_21130 [Ornithinibacter aureus]|uniref:OmpA-like domain-containing protein n=1 Tax=Ornithinibacter aureus TaxID=622664 RepID=A0ABP8JX63_9MICO|nr:OmpA family protein [Ornithinibacter aureus]KAF0834557.1 outer membrane protein OmpA-like peptidoglycan-associated protein [Ornithinibacter aureus]